MTVWPQYEVFASPRGRILCMDSMGHVDTRNDVSDVLICGSHSAPCATQLVLWARPRGLIGHDAGIGKDDGGVAGLALLDEYLIPGACVSAASARIGDGRDMYENGILSRVNRAAERLGLTPGTTAKAATHRLLDANPVPVALPKRQILVHDSPLGRVYALDTVKYADARISGAVLCMGSHAAPAMADYVAEFGFALAGVITNDVGFAKDRSGIGGLAALDARAVPGATVSCASARVGDAQDTYFSGVVSACNATAAALGIAPGQSAAQAAERMLREAAGRRSPT